MRQQNDRDKGTAETGSTAGADRKSGGSEPVNGVYGKRKEIHTMKRRSGKSGISGNRIKGTVALTAIAAVLLAGCGQEEGSEVAAVQSESVVEGTGAKETEDAAGNAENSQSAEGENAGEKSVEEIYGEITQGVELISPVQMGDDFITNYYGIAPEKLDGYVFAMSEDATSAETVVIMKVKDAGDVEAMVGALQVVVDEKRSEMQDYLPEQFEIVDKSSVKSKGNYVYLVISENADTILQIVEKDL